MLISFQSEAAADVIMFDHVAMSMLKMMDRDATVPSAMYSEDIPQALLRLRAAISALPDEVSDEDAIDADAEDQVSLKVRAVPLIQLLEASAQNGKHVLWDFAGP
jgi:hypothetical protein